jgi:hypothetical protein
MISSGNRQPIQDGTKEFGSGLHNRRNCEKDHNSSGSPDGSVKFFQEKSSSTVKQSPMSIAIALIRLLIDFHSDHINIRITNHPVLMEEEFLSINEMTPAMD